MLDSEISNAAHTGGTHLKKNRMNLINERPVHLVSTPLTICEENCHSSHSPRFDRVADGHRRAAIPQEQKSMQQAGASIDHASVSACQSAGRKRRRAYGRALVGAQRFETVQTRRISAIPVVEEYDHVLNLSEDY